LLDINQNCLHCWARFGYCLYRLLIRLFVLTFCKFCGTGISCPINFTASNEHMHTSCLMLRLGCGAMGLLEIELTRSLRGQVTSSEWTSLRSLCSKKTFVAAPFSLLWAQTM